MANPGLILVADLGLHRGVDLKDRKELDQFVSDGESETPLGAQIDGGFLIKEVVQAHIPGRLVLFGLIFDSRHILEEVIGYPFLAETQGQDQVAEKGEFVEQVEACRLSSSPPPGLIRKR